MAKLTSSRGDDLFDPGFDNKTPEFTKASQGVVPDRSTGTLLGGIGDFIKDKFQADDAFLKQRTREEATTEVDKIRNMQTGLDQRQGGWTLSAVGVNTPDQVVQEIQKRGDRLARIDQAYKSGNLTASHKYMLYDTAARELRSKYPGYREHIDNVFKDLTGVDPANALIESIRQDATRGGKENNEQKMLQQMVKTASSEGWMPPGFSADGNFLPVNAKGQPVAPADFINAAGKYRAQKYTRDQEMGEIDAAEKSGKWELNRTIEFAAKKTDDIANTGFKAAIGVVGSNPDEIKANLVKLQQDAANKKLSPDELNKARAEYAVARSSAERAYDLEMTKIPGWSKIPAEKRAELKKNFNTPWDSYEDIITNKNFGLALYFETTANTQLAGTYAHLVDKEETLRNMNAIKKVGGEVAVGMYLTQNAGVLSDLSHSMSVRSLNRMAATGAPLKEEITRAAAQAKISQPQFYDGLVNGMIDTITTKGMPKELVQQSIEALYGKGNKNMLQELPFKVSVEKQREYYAKMTSPAVMDSVLNYAKTSGDEKAWANYYQWTTNSFVNSNQVNGAAKEIKRLSMETDLPWGAKFNPEVSSFEVVQRNRANPQLYRGMDIARYQAQIQGAVDDMNRHIAPIKRLRETTKEDPNPIIMDVFRFNGIDINDLSYRPK